MKKSGILAASVAAAAISATSSSSSSSSKFRFPQEDNFGKERSENNSVSSEGSSDKFAPRFDGLRFIETLVTAHR